MPWTAVTDLKGSDGESGTITSVTVTALPAGATPTVTVGGTPTARTIALGIPKGDTGDPASNLVTSVSGRQGAVTLGKSDVGLANVDNTADTAKPVSTAQQTALNLKANLASPTFTGTVAGITKAMVGLSNVDNTTDAAKPISTATSTALALKAPLASPAFTGTPTGITKTHVGLANVDNTADSAKPVSIAQQTALDLKAPLASPAFTGTPTGITKTHVGLGNVDNTADSAKPISTAQASALAAKADLVGGLVPTSQIPALAINEVFVVASETAMLGLAAQRGDMAIRETGRTYVLSSDSPATLADWKEVMAAGQVTSVSGKTGVVSLAKTDVGLANVDNTADADKPISTATATALSGKAATAHTHTVANITDASVVGANVLKATDAAAARTAIGAGTSNLVIGTSAGQAADAAALTTSLALKAPLASPTFTGTVSGVTKAMVGLANVDNTADTAKPVSTAQQTALNGKANTVHTHVATDVSDSTLVGRNLITAVDAATARTAIGAGTSSLVIGTGAGQAADAAALTTSLAAKAPLASPAFTGTVTGITKAMVGLGSVDNTADTAKPVSTAQQAALDLKAPLASPTFTGTVSGVTKAHVGLANVDNTADSAKPVSTAQAAAIAAKADIAHTHTVANITDATVTGANVLKAADATAARTAIGAGTSNLVIGTSAGQAADAAALTASLAGKANTVHTHVIADVTGLQAALDSDGVDLTGAVEGQALVYNATTGKVTASVGTQTAVRAEKGLYLPSEAALIRWRTDLARTRNGSQQSHVAVIGDSIAAGFGSTSPKTAKSWVARLRNSLDAQYGASGTGLIPALNVFRTDATYQNQVTFSGTYGTAAFGLFGKANWRVTPGAYFEVTASNVNEFVVVVASGGNAVLNEITIDGGAVQTVKNWVDTEPVAPSITPQPGYHSKTMVNVIPAGAVGMHTMRFTRPTSGTGSDAFVFYVEARNNTNGRVRVSSLAGPSESINSFMVPANETTGLTGLNMIDITRADLLVVGLGINDWQQQIPLATTRTRIEQIIDRQRSSGTNVGGGLHPDGDVVLLWNPQPDIATLGGGLFTNPTWDAYRQMFYDIALAKDVALVDLGGSWKDYTTANTVGLYNGTIHPNDAGSADMARNIERALFGASSAGTSVGGTSLPEQTGNEGKVLATNGVVSEWSATGTINTTDAPQPLGTPNPGTATYGAAAWDHVHPLPPSPLGFQQILASGTYTVDVTGTYEIAVVGSGGAGGGGGSSQLTTPVAQLGGAGGGSGVRQTAIATFTAGQVITFALATAPTGGAGGAASTGATGSAGATGGQGSTSTATWTGGSVSAAGGAGGAGSAASTATTWPQQGNPGQPFFGGGGWPGSGAQNQFSLSSPGALDAGVGTGGGGGGAATTVTPKGGTGGAGGTLIAASASGGSAGASATTAGTAGGAGAFGGGGGGGGAGAAGGAGGQGGAGGAGYATVRRLL